MKQNISVKIGFFFCYPAIYFPVSHLNSPLIQSIVYVLHYFSSSGIYTILLHSLLSKASLLHASDLMGHLQFCGQMLPIFLGSSNGGHNLEVL